MQIKGYQVLNESGYPASRDCDMEDLAIYETYNDARRWVKYLKEEVDLDIEKYSIRKVTVTI